MSGASVVQTDTSLGNKVVVGIGGGTANAIGLGAFNNTYLSSGANAPGAALYACGDDSTNDAPVLFAFPFTSIPTAGTLNPTPLVGSGLFLTTGPTIPGSCSSITENFNQTTNKDEIFVGVSAGTTGNCGTGEIGGCILAFDVTAGFPPGTPSTAPAAHVVEPGGTSGIIVDNVADQGNGTQVTTDIYFLSGKSQPCSRYSGGSSSGNCAVSLTQTGLH